MIIKKVGAGTLYKLTQMLGYMEEEQYLWDLFKTRKYDIWYDGEIVLFHPKILNGGYTWFAYLDEAKEAMKRLIKLYGKDSELTLVNFDRYDDSSLYCIIWLTDDDLDATITWEMIDNCVEGYDEHVKMKEKLNLL